MELKVNRTAIDAAMTALKLNQAQLAERAGVSPALISRLLNPTTGHRRRKRGAGYTALVCIARALNHPVDELFPVESPVQPAPRDGRRSRRTSATVSA